MTVEYVVLGVILILMGVVQVWLRHGPGSRARDDEERPARAHDESERAREATGPAGQYSAGRIRSGRAWEAWTAILGGLGIVVGIVLVVVGALGR